MYNILSLRNTIEANAHWPCPNGRLAVARPGAQRQAACRDPMAALPTWRGEGGGQKRAYRLGDGQAWKARRAARCSTG
jgi:hypothetical protein